MIEINLKDFSEEELYLFLVEKIVTTNKYYHSIRGLAHDLLFSNHWLAERLVGEYLHNDYNFISLYYFLDSIEDYIRDHPTVNNFYEVLDNITKEGLWKE